MNALMCVLLYWHFGHCDESRNVRIKDRKTVSLCVSLSLFRSHEFFVFNDHHFGSGITVITVTSTFSCFNKTTETLNQPEMMKRIKSSRQ
jgi:uncharacterized protein YmfQ (DUF2313 family)